MVLMVSFAADEDFKPEGSASEPDDELVTIITLQRVV